MELSSVMALQSGAKENSVVSEAGRDPAIVRAQELTKTYARGSETVHALDKVTISISSGEFVAITGPSGAGKTTLLHLIGCMDVPTSGELVLGGKPTKGLTDAKLTRLRRERI
ncbi:MAG TPA: ATP-binding cassette domain-containing protein, partial [Chthonomonadales bacterium]|nr:ATP-binding cassette domain-containing protein [Chthonomonadales bacterium]